MNNKTIKQLKEEILRLTELNNIHLKRGEINWKIQNVDIPLAQAKLQQAEADQKIFLKFCEDFEKELRKENSTNPDINAIVSRGQVLDILQKLKSEVIGE